MIMYVIMFFAACKLRFTYLYSPENFSIPGGKIGLVFVCLLGLFGCGITIFIGFIPPFNIDVGNHFLYELYFCTGMISLILPVFFFYWYKAKHGMVREEDNK